MKSEIEAEDEALECNVLELGTKLMANNISRVEEKNFIVLGDRACGKSTLSNYFFNQTSASTDNKPTAGINYSYIRAQPGFKKTLSNIYEIGGGSSNVGLIKTIINETSIKNSVFLICLDFSKPNRLLASLNNYLNLLRKVITDIIGERNQDVINELVDNKKQRYNSEINQGDLKRLKLFPAEVVVVGTKYDYLEKIEIEKLKWVCRCLRFFCHINGLSLVYIKQPYNESDIKQIKHFTHLISSLGWTLESTSLTNVDSYYSQKDHLLALFIVQGQDSFMEIGDPKVIDKGTNKDIVQLWEDSFYSLYQKQSNYDDDEQIKSTINLEQYAEPKIDAELDNFEKKKESFLKQKEVYSKEKGQKVKKSK